MARGETAGPGVEAEVDTEAAAVGVGVGAVELKVLLPFEHALVRATRDMSAIRQVSRRNGIFIF